MRCKLFILLFALLSLVVCKSAVKKIPVDQVSYDDIVPRLQKGMEKKLYNYYTQGKELYLEKKINLKYQQYFFFERPAEKVIFKLNVDVAMAKGLQKKVINANMLNVVQRGDVENEKQCKSEIVKNKVFYGKLAHIEHSGKIYIVCDFSYETY